MQNYVIQTKQGYVKWASILSFTEDNDQRIIRINNTQFTNNLQEADVFTEEDKKEDLIAWEEYFGITEGSNFSYLPIEYKLK